MPSLPQSRGTIHRCGAQLIGARILPGSDCPSFLIHSFQPDLFSILPLAKKLRTLHINFPLESSQSTPAVLLDYQALGLAMCCSSTLTQIGGNTRVWQVGHFVLMLLRVADHVSGRSSAKFIRTWMGKFCSSRNSLIIVTTTFLNSFSSFVLKDKSQ